MSILNSLSTVNIYDDATSTNNPQQQFANWKRNILGMSVSNPTSTRMKILPGQTANIFSGSVSTLIDGTSAFSIALNPVNSSIYRITNTAGTAPGFKTARSVAVSGILITVAINNNATATFTAGGAIFGSVQVGDTMFIPTSLSGDAALNNVFSVLNGGLWTVIGVTTTQLTVIRPAGTLFSGTAEAVTPTSNSHLQLMASDGVQVGNTLEITAGFSSVSRKAFTVSAVTPTWVEVVSTVALPLETGIVPGIGGMVFYNKAKTFLSIQVDQEAVIRLNGDTGNFNRLSTTTNSSGVAIGWFEKGPGPCWQLDVVNRSTVNVLNIVIMSAE